MQVFKSLKKIKILARLPRQFLLKRAGQAFISKVVPGGGRRKDGFSTGVAGGRAGASPGVVLNDAKLPDPFKAKQPAFTINQARVRELALTGPAADTIMHRAREAADHRFDLLGSGPVNLGFSGEDGSGYRPIEWHIDFKAGYRWDPQVPGRQQKISPVKGADVKVPWELSRFQHAAALGLAGLLDGESGCWAEEFMLQVTDWIKANPYPYGINWSCTMDVAIRVVNWLWGWILFKDHPALTEEFKAGFLASLEQHGRHIEHNLEFISRGYHGNHYLADIAGLVYLGGLLPGLAESDRWLAFGIQELVEEMKHQVYADGFSFEGSTAYHRLAAEIFYSATAGGLNLDQKRKEALKKYEAGEQRIKPALKPYREQEFDLESETVFPRWYYNRLQNMAEVILDLSGPDGKVPQFGDSDSGRLHKFSPVVTEEGEECFNDHRHILALAGQLFGRADFTDAGEAYRFDAELLMGQVPFLPLRSGKRKRQVSSRLAQLTVGDSSADDDSEERALAGKVTGKPGKGLTAELTFTFRAGAGSGAGAGVETGALEPAMPRVYYYPDGGLALYKNELYYFAFACIPCGLGGVGAHNHNDLLSFVLNVGTQDFFVDGGSYLYSADATLRNAFRSTRAHNTVAVRGREQREMTEDYLFILPQKGKAAISELSAGRVRGYHDGFGFRHSREVSFAAESITVRDHLAKRCQAEQILNLAPGVQIEAGEKGRVYLNNGNVQLELSGTGVKDMVVEEGFYSPCYGKRVANKRLVIPFRG